MVKKVLNNKNIVFCFLKSGKTKKIKLSNAKRKESRKTNGIKDFEGPKTFMNPFKK